MNDIANKALEMAQKAGAQQAACGISQAREVQVEWRDGQLQKMSDATTRSLGLQLYVDGRYSSVSTSDLRPAALERFIGDTVAMTRLITPDPFRTLPDTELYAGQSSADLELFDPETEMLTPEDRLLRVQALEAGARESKAEIISVTTAFSDSTSRSYRVHSNGFCGEKRQSSAFISAEVTMQDKDGRRPEESDYAGSRFLRALPDPVGIGRSATQRALSRLGAHKLASMTVPIVLDNRASLRFLSYFLGPLSAAQVQQKRSYFEGRIGEKVAHELLTLTDDPLLPRGFGSRVFDGEGIAAKKLPILDHGVVKNLYVDTYYGKKLKMRPTTGGMSNLVVGLGDQDQAALLRSVGEGILITGFLGGNSNGTTGDFSLGIFGHRISHGQRAEPIAEMNISGNHLETWKHLAALGNDPYPYSSMRAPTLVFEAMPVAGK